MERLMIGLVITGHGQFAAGLVSALELLIGHQDLLTAVDFEAGQNEDLLTEHLKHAVEGMHTCDEILILCDMIGGSPYKCAVRPVSYTHLSISDSGTIYTFPILRICFKSSCVYLLIYF